MAGPRRRTQAPTPPALGGIAIDGSNVIASGLGRAGQRLELAVAWFRAWRPDLATSVFLDDSTFLKCSGAAATRLEQLCADSNEQLRFVRCPLRSPADVHALEDAVSRQALLVSNDRFWDHEPLRRGAITVQFVLEANAFRPYEEATWFRPSGGAQRVALRDLRSHAQT